MEKTASYYRARLEVFKQLIKSQAAGSPTNDNLDLRILRNGVVPTALHATCEQLINEYKKDQPDNALQFIEIIRFNTWFEIYPEKIAGTEVITTSREFPIMIKGSEEDIIRTLTPANLPDTNSKKDKRVRKARAKAIARTRRLELMKV